MRSQASGEPMRRSRAAASKGGVQEAGASRPASHSPRASRRASASAALQALLQRIAGDFDVLQREGGVLLPECVPLLGGAEAAQPFAAQLVRQRAVGVPGEKGPDDLRRSLVQGGHEKPVGGIRLEQVARPCARAGVSSAFTLPRWAASRAATMSASEACAVAASARQASARKHFLNKVNATGVPIAYSRGHYRVSAHPFPRDAREGSSDRVPLDRLPDATGPHSEEKEAWKK